MERKIIAAAVSSALALPMAAQAVEFSVSGQVNRAIISVDGGADDGDLKHMDANSSGTRFRFTGSEELDSGLTAGVQYEYALDTSVRQANVYLSSVGGKLTVGHGSRATDGVAHADLGGPAFLGGATNWCS
ncbi:MAG: porin, partial [Rhodospirillales bacterium]|nr:porin [Rhodospirillales bacterium]